MDDKEREKTKLRQASEAFGIMLGFGVSFAVEIYVIGVLFGGWLDEKIGGGKGYLTLACVLLAIVFGFVTFYRDLLKRGKRRQRSAGTSSREESDEDREDRTD